MVRARQDAINWRLSMGDSLVLIMLTLVPEKFASARGQINDLISRFRQDGEFEHTWVIERNPAGTGHHVHMLAFHARPITEEALYARWGHRIVGLRPAAPNDGGYLLKGAYKALQPHLSLNGGRLTHQSRRFIPDVALRDAERLARHESRIRRLT